MQRFRDWLAEQRTPSDPIDGILWTELRPANDDLGLWWLLRPKELATETFEVVVETGAEPIPLAAAFSEAIAHMGRLVDVALIGPDVTVAGVVGGGFMNKNPAVIAVRILSMADGPGRATVTGIAKEGRIKQGTSQKAVRRVLDASELAGVREVGTP